MFYRTLSLRVKLSDWFLEIGSLMMQEILSRELPDSEVLEPTPGVPLEISS